MRQMQRNSHSYSRRKGSALHPMQRNPFVSVIACGLLAVFVSAISCAGQGQYFSPDSKHLAAVVAQDGSAKLWYRDTPNSAPRFVCEVGEAASVVWSPDGKMFAVSARNNSTDSWVAICTVDQRGPSKPRLADGGLPQDASFHHWHPVALAWDGRGLWIELHAHGDRSTIDGVFLCDPETGKVLETYSRAKEGQASSGANGGQARRR